MMRILTLLLSLPIVACTGAPESPAVTRPDTLPTPFTADQIRDAMPQGFSLVMQNTTADGARRERWDVVDADAHGMALRTTAPLGSDTPTTDTRRHAWAVLRNHASFPAGTASRTRVTIDTPLAEAPLAGWRYDVPGADGVRTVFLFADTLPGPPVRVETFRDEAVVATMSQVARTGTRVPPETLP